MADEKPGCEYCSGQMDDREKLVRTIREFRAPIGVRIGLTVVCVLLFFVCAVCGIACLVAAPAEAGYLWWGLGWLAAGIASAGGIVYFADV